MKFVSRKKFAFTNLLISIQLCPFKTQLKHKFMYLNVWCLNLWFIKLFITFKIENMKFTFPLSISSLCAEDAAFTRAEVAAAMDLAASRIISSKFRLSSASYKQQVNRSLFSWTCKWEFNNDHQQESVVMVVKKNTVKYAWC